MRQRYRSANMKCKVSSKDLASMSDVQWSALGEADAFNRSDVISDPLLAHILRKYPHFWIRKKIFQKLIPPLNKKRDKTDLIWKKTKEVGDHWLSWWRGPVLWDPGTITRAGSPSISPDHRYLQLHTFLDIARIYFMRSLYIMIIFVGETYLKGIKFQNWFAPQKTKMILIYIYFGAVPKRTSVLGRT